MDLLDTLRDLAHEQNPDGYIHYPLDSSQDSDEGLQFGAGRPVHGRMSSEDPTDYTSAELGDIDQLAYYFTVPDSAGIEVDDRIIVEDVPHRVTHRKRAMSGNFSRFVLLEDDRATDSDGDGEVDHGTDSGGTDDGDGFEWS